MSEFDFGVILRALPFLWQGMQLTLALTALAMKGDEARIRAAGCDGYIAKPLAYRDFLATISARLMTPALEGK